MHRPFPDFAFPHWALEKSDWGRDTRHWAHDRRLPGGSLHDRQSRSALPIPSPGSGTDLVNLPHLEQARTLQVRHSRPVAQSHCATENSLRPFDAPHLLQSRTLHTRQTRSSPGRAHSSFSKSARAFDAPHLRQARTLHVRQSRSSPRRAHSSGSKSSPAFAVLHFVHNCVA